jgi:hypothetical protein
MEIALLLTSKKLKPGQPGIKRLATQYGACLVCVRYRYDAELVLAYRIELRNVSNN